MGVNPFDSWNNICPDVDEIRLRMIRAAIDLHQFAAQQSDPAKALEMRKLADQMETLAGETWGVGGEHIPVPSS